MKKILKIMFITAALIATKFSVAKPAPNKSPYDELSIAKSASTKSSFSKSSIAKNSVSQPEHSPTKLAVANTSIFQTKKQANKLAIANTSVPQPEHPPTKLAVANTSIFQTKKQANKLAIANTSVPQPEHSPTKLAVANTSIFQTKQPSNRLAIANTSVFQPEHSPTKLSVTNASIFQTKQPSNRLAIANTSVFQPEHSPTKLSVTNASIFQTKQPSNRLAIANTSVFQPEHSPTKLSVANTSVSQPSATLPSVRIERLSVPKMMRFKQTVYSLDPTGKSTDSIAAGTERKFVARFEWESKWYYVTDWSMKRQKDGILADYLEEIKPSVEEERFERERAGIFDFDAMIYVAKKQVNTLTNRKPQNGDEIAAAQAYLDFLKVKQQQIPKELALEWSRRVVDTIDEQFRRDWANTEFYKKKYRAEIAPELNYDLLSQVISQSIHLRPEKKNIFEKYLAFIDGKWKVNEAEKWLHGGGDCVAFNLYMEGIKLFDQANRPNEKIKAMTSIRSIAQQAMKKGITYFNYKDYQVAWGIYRKTNYFYEKLEQLGDTIAEANRLEAVAGMDKSLDAAKRNRKDDLDQWWTKINRQSETTWQNDLGFIIVNDELSLRSLHANYNCFIPSASLTPEEVRVHRYNSSDIILDSFRVPIRQDSALRQRIGQNLGINSDQLNEKEFVITIQDPINHKSDSDSTNFMLCPQWVFERYYGEGDDNLTLSGNVDTKVKVFSSNWQTSSAFSTTGALSWNSLTGEKEIYRNPEGAELTRFPRVAISSNSHPLDFNNIDNSSKIVLSNTRFLDGPVQGEVKTALNFVFSKTAYNRLKDYCKTQRTIEDIFKTLHSEGHIPKDIMELLEIPIN